ncbi:hypothetical protein SDC9_159290 [bioreactor metagenome]|uniref:Uncharacterized protein n=1 Tax=bioreactor metagenome TaxID=1076179 RepID=A0A645FCC9_9ZZZZ
MRGKDIESLLLIGSINFKTFIELFIFQFNLMGIRPFAEPAQRLTVTEQPVFIAADL